MDNLIDKIKAIIEDRFKEADLEDCFLVDILVNNTKLEVYIDTDEGVSFKKCQKLSRAIEAYLDESKAIGEKYTLEVSSPGVGRPLKFRRQYPRNIGRKMKVKLKDGSSLKGKLTGINDNVLTIESKGQKKKEVIINEIDFEQIESSEVLITF
ncbi:MAG: ribosome maturation factor RimP [Saprospiraceae bacterium]|nr:ribosome maturation factor RimP [Bacteroidia bacterium]NNE15140.1 ribosome maturation factor RimP [Saprospiraceae bacterium]NNL92981.1 ribosome maturation factor RimP [Saprospiraceae bacterium]